mmetsp:Transcript_3236/g.8624  ORF Transcript_3236/g.8624 Transcript_3236/m.8624 type:complete len:225 (-) Transcript_3236:892-1566(-)
MDVIHGRTRVGGTVRVHTRRPGHLLRVLPADDDRGVRDGGAGRDIHAEHIPRRVRRRRPRAVLPRGAPGVVGYPARSLRPHRRNRDARRSFSIVHIAGGHHGRRDRRDHVRVLHHRRRRRVQRGVVVAAETRRVPHGSQPQRTRGVPIGGTAEEIRAAHRQGPDGVARRVRRRTRAAHPRARATHVHVAQRVPGGGRQGPFSGHVPAFAAQRFDSRTQSRDTRV